MTIEELEVKLTQWRKTKKFDAQCFDVSSYITKKALCTMGSTLLIGGGGVTAWIGAGLATGGAAWVAGGVVAAIGGFYIRTSVCTSL